MQELAEHWALELGINKDKRSVRTRRRTAIIANVNAQLRTVPIAGSSDLYALAPPTSRKNSWKACEDVP